MRGWALAALLVAAGALRFAALGFGAADFEARPDERSVAVTLDLMDRGQLFPPLVAYGGGYFEPLRAFVRVSQILRGRERPSRGSPQALRPNGGVVNEARHDIPRDVAPGGALRFRITSVAPNTEGTYTLELSVSQVGGATMSNVAMAHVPVGVIDAGVGGRNASGSSQPHSLPGGTGSSQRTTRNVLGGFGRA